MSDFRAFCTPPAGNEIRLSSEESHHLVTVNRARRGDSVVAFDGQGTEWSCELAVDSKREAVLHVRSVRQAAPRAFALTLAQALPKGPAMDAIIRKATEIGAARIVPVESERTQVHLEGDRSGRKVEKWQVAALEAAKQCGNPWLPEITPVQSFAELLAHSADQDLKLIASLHPDARSLKTALADFHSRQGRSPHTAVWLIGPEGDFSPGETRLALDAGFLPVTLGPLVLRCETAAIYALSILSYELLEGSGSISCPSC